jgi:hypothetical protein
VQASAELARRMLLGRPMRQVWTQQGSLTHGLAADHQELELLFGRVMASLRGADGERIRQRWLELDHALEQHLCTEEELLLPQLTRERAEDAARVRAEHRAIRTALVDLGVDLDLHSLCPGAAARFIDALRRHAAFEDAVIYPWAERHLAEQTRLSLLERLVARVRHPLANPPRVIGLAKQEQS